MGNIAIIPARGGSKRIPRKNIKDFLGKPIIAYSIEIALNSDLFEEVMVSTDDEEIAETSLKYGAKVPFFRSEKNSNDFASTVDVIDEVLTIYKNNGIRFSFACCIYPTAAIIRSDRIVEAYNLLIERDYDSVVPIVPFSYPSQRALIINEQRVNFLWPENINIRSQDLVNTYHDCGQFYWLNVLMFHIKRGIFTENTGAIILSELEAQDIDSLTDWKIAEIKKGIIGNN